MDGFPTSNVRSWKTNMSFFPSLYLSSIISPPHAKPDCITTDPFPVHRNSHVPGKSHLPNGGSLEPCRPPPRPSPPEPINRCPKHHNVLTIMTWFLYPVNPARESCPPVNTTRGLGPQRRLPLSRCIASLRRCLLTYSRSTGTMRTQSLAYHQCSSPGISFFFLKYF